MTEDIKKQPPFRVMTAQEQADWLTMIESIQKKPGESDADWRRRYRLFEETGRTDLPPDVRERLRQYGESVEEYLDRLKAWEGDDPNET